jgi:apolipoprotein N-acyltransferase
VKRRRHRLNPAKVKADLASLGRTAPTAGRQDAGGRRALVALLPVASSVLLLVSFAPFNRWYLAYVALVPFGLAALTGRSAGWAMLWAYLGGVVFWSVGLYWLTWITLVGYVPLMLYLGTYWLVPGWLLRRAFARGWPMWLCLPLVWVALEYARGFALGGFPWFYLAHSQHANTALIQVADVTGQYGVSFFVAMVNGAVLDLLAPALAGRGLPRPGRRAAVAWAACALAAGGLLGYGRFRLGQPNTYPGPKVGLVQMAYPNSLFYPGAESQEIFDAHVVNSSPLVGQGCDLVLWPESMLVFPNMDPTYWRRFDADASQPAPPHAPLFTPQQQETIRIYQGNLRTLRQLVGELGCPLLAGGGMPAPVERLTYNSALLFERDRSGSLVIRERYAKRHLVPFGEYVPFRGGWPWLHRLLRRFVPEEMPQLEPGERITRFPVASASGPMHFVVPICYEGVFDRVCRSMVMEGTSKRADLLVNISNDGWFIWNRGGGKTHASTELEQHLAQYVFRAIENRLPVVRAVNTGVSGYIDSDGRVQATVHHGGQAKMVAGTLVVQTLADRRVSLYSLTGDVFAAAVCVAAVVGSAALLRRPGSTQRKAGKA